MNYFVTAIGTDSGKTVVSAILCKALSADYWKPIQAGIPGDSETIKNLLRNTDSVIHPEKYVFKTPASPHAAAEIENISIHLNDFLLPKTKKDLIIEGAGGCLVPINENDFVIDLATKFSAQVILVADLYLGSINHTLLTFEALERRNIKVKGIVFNGHANLQSERIILHHTQLPCLLRITRENDITTNTIYHYAQQLSENWHE
jgi:dethiobiotin synthetase